MVGGAGSTAKAPAPNAFVVDATGAVDFHDRVNSGFGEDSMRHLIVLQKW